MNNFDPFSFTHQEALGLLPAYRQADDPFELDLQARPSAPDRHQYTPFSQTIYTPRSELFEDHVFEFSLAPSCPTKVEEEAQDPRELLFTDHGLEASIEKPASPSIKEAPVPSNPEEGSSEQNLYLPSSSMVPPPTEHAQLTACPASRTIKKLSKAKQSPKVCSEPSQARKLPLKPKKCIDKRGKGKNLQKAPVQGENERNDEDDQMFDLQEAGSDPSADLPEPSLRTQLHHLSQHEQAMKEATAHVFIHDDEESLAGNQNQYEPSKCNISAEFSTTESASDSSLLASNGRTEALLTAALVRKPQMSSAEPASKTSGKTKKQSLISRVKYENLRGKFRKKYEKTVRDIETRRQLIETANFKSKTLRARQEERKCLVNAIQSAKTRFTTDINSHLVTEKIKFLKGQLTQLLAATSSMASRTGLAKPSLEAIMSDVNHRPMPDAQKASAEKLVQFDTWSMLKDFPLPGYSYKIDSDATVRLEHDDVLKGRPKSNSNGK